MGTYRVPNSRDVCTLVYIYIYRRRGQNYRIRILVDTVNEPDNPSNGPDVLFWLSGSDMGLGSPGQVTARRRRGETGETHQGKSGGDL